eukprot:Hpha_TRINITY_DN16271_c3_g7::TRINITY_DN16271_c3_g7_i1::g.13585::m.13585
MNCRLVNVGLLIAALCLHEAAAGGGATTGGTTPSVLPPPAEGHPGWLFVMSHEGVHLVDSDGNGTDTLWRWSSTTLDKAYWPDKCIPSGMAVDHIEQIVVWACNSPTDVLVRKVFRVLYNFKPILLQEVTFADSNQPGERGGVAVDPFEHHAYVAIHNGQGWRVETFPLHKCEDWFSQKKCDLHSTEGCKWINGFCLRDGQGVEVLLARTDYREGAGLTYSEKNMMLSLFKPPDSGRIAKNKEDGTGTIQYLKLVREMWEDLELTTFDRFHIGHPVASHDADPDHKVYLAAVGDGETRIYRVDPYDKEEPLLVYTLNDAPFRSPGTDGVTDPYNLEGVPMPGHATLWDQHDMVYSTGMSIKRINWETKTEKTIMTGWAKMGIMGPVVWFPHEPKDVPTQAPISPTQGPVVPPTAPPEQAGTPTAPPQQAASQPTDAPKGGSATTAPLAATPTGAPVVTTNTNNTGAPLTTAVVPSSPTKAPAPLTNAPTFGPVKEEPGSCDTICLVLIIAAVVLLCCLIAGFIAWYMKSKVPVSLPPEEPEEKEAPLVEEPSAPLEQVTIEALPLGLGANDLSDDMMGGYKFNAKAHLKQLRNGEDLHDPALDAEAKRRAEMEAARRAQEEEEKKQLVEDNMQRLLAGLQGTEVDDAVDQWKDTQEASDNNKDRNSPPLRYSPESDRGTPLQNQSSGTLQNPGVGRSKRQRAPVLMLDQQAGYQPPDSHSNGSYSSPPHAYASSINGSVSGAGRGVGPEQNTYSPIAPSGRGAAYGSGTLHDSRAGSGRISQRSVPSHPPKRPGSVSGGAPKTVFTSQRGGTDFKL